ncbi:MAG: hypothetical protein M0Q02_11640, partial [Candidatus Muirbacterium halophilum]|nr:hypothetical protein [Candidatus Muirbacterium halophilum]
KQYESMLNNLYFANKIININPKIDNSAIIHPSMKGITKDLLMSTLRDRAKGSFETIKNNLKDSNLKKYLESIETEFQKRLLVNDLKFVKNEFNIVSFDFLMIELAFIVNNQHFEMEVWYEKSGDSYKVDHITNLISISYELSKVPTKVQTEPAEMPHETTSPLLYIILIIITLILFGSIIGFIIIKKKKQKEQAIEQTFKNDNDDILIESENEITHSDDKTTEFTQIAEDNIKEKTDFTEIKKDEEQVIKEKVKLKTVLIQKFDILKNKVKNIFEKIQNKIVCLKTKLKDKATKKPKNKVKEEKIIEKVYSLSDIYPEDLDSFRSSRIEDFDFLEKILNKDTVHEETIEKQEKKPVILTTIEENEIPVLSDDVLENIVDELETSVKSGAVLDEELEENTNQFTEALDELSIQTPIELIEAEKKELNDKKIAKDLGVNDLIGEEDLDEYLNLEIISGDGEDNSKTEEEVSLVKDDNSQSKKDNSLLEDVNSNNEKNTEDDSDELLALDELLNLNDDDEKN